MVRKYSLFKRSAFTLIELIFAIVIIAISVMSLPMMTQATSKGIEANIVQEVIFATGAILNESTTYYWDSNSMNDANTTSAGYSRVVNTVVGGVNECLGGGVPYQRVGHINRQCLDDNTTTPNAVGNASSVEWSANVYNNIEILTDVAGAATYKDEYNATAIVNSCGAGGCVQFGEELNNPNLKEIEIQVTSSDSADILVLFRAYVANIGEVRPERRDF